MPAVLKDGFKTLVDFQNLGAVFGVTLKERTVTPPGMDGGGFIDITTMRNTRWRTRWMKQLMTLTEFTFTAAYDPAVYQDILNQMQVNQTVTVIFPNGDQLVFYGFLDKFVPGENKEGEFPLATCTVVPTNLNTSDEEVAPTYTPFAS